MMQEQISFVKKIVYIGKSKGIIIPAKLIRKGIIRQDKTYKISLEEVAAPQETEGGVLCLDKVQE